MKRKIMFMINSLDGGGAEKVLQTLLKNLDYEKYDITLYSMHRENIKQLDYPKQIQYKVVFDKYRGDILSFRRIHNLYSKIKGKIFQKCSSKLFYRLFIHEKYDVEIAFIEGESTKIIAGSNNKNSKKYAWVHIDLKENPWTEFLYKGVKDEESHYQEFDKILCVSKSVKEAFLSKFINVDYSKVKVQYNPINRQKILDMSKFKCNIHSKEKLRIISVGRLVKQKGFDRLLKVCSQLKEENYIFEVFIIGEGEERKYLESMIENLNLKNIVFLLGYTKNPYSIMVTGDILVCSSRSEGFSTVLTEGVVLGMPIISTDCAGVKELFGNSQCGVIVKNDTKELYYALKELFNDPNKLNSYRKEAFERGKDFTLSRTMKEIQKLIDI